MKINFLKNPGWKLGGLLLALALWFHLTTEQQFNKNITVDIDYINIPDSLVLTDTSQKSAIVQITASGKKLFKLLYFDDIRLIIDLCEYTKPGAYSEKLSREQMTNSAEMTGVGINFIGVHVCDFELIRQE
ncbi:MAG: hypothetical protein J7K40_13410 [candidate division Zixibacteria bacterium]|nr:hypothetical protein [candidate division Zixibacteria bacterium]